MAQHADIWHSFSDAPTLERKLGILAEHGAAVGRDTSEIEVSVELSRKSPEEADELHAIGATLFTVAVSGPKHNLDRVAEWIAWRDAKNAG